MNEQEVISMYDRKKMFDRSRLIMIDELKFDTREKLSLKMTNCFRLDRLNGIVYQSFVVYHV